jgi:RND family efflux transporter MFP subunit
MRLLSVALLCMACIPAACVARAAATQPLTAQPRAVQAVAVVITDYRPATEITGEIAAQIQSSLSFRTGGRVTERLVDVGSHVRRGDVLARIDDTEQQADVDIARAKLQSAAATRVQKKLAYDRYEALLQSQTVSQATFDQAREELVTAHGAEETAKASLTIAQDALAYTEMKADADGIITARTIEVGQVVSAAQAALTLAHDGPRDATFDVFEALFFEGTPADDVDVTPIDGSGTVRAKIREISPALDTKAGTIRVKVTLPEDAQWPLGTPVKGEFRSPSRSGAIVPWSTLTSTGGDPAVWIIDPDTRTVSLRRISVERYRTGDVVVAGGIEAKDLVVTQGGQFLREGQSVSWENPR